MEAQRAEEMGGDPLLTVNKMEDVTIGMRVEARDSYGKWFRAKVVDKDEETEEVVVHFDGWSSRYDELLHIRDGKLRRLTQEQLEKTKTRKTKTLYVGDRVQAKWQDGRMYFGKVLQLLKDMAVVLFDDGVKYTTPITAVRKRRVGPSPSGGESSHVPVPVRGRKRKLTESKGATEDSASQLSASPPSSPLFAPKRVHSRSISFWETDDSSGTESDAEEDQRKRPRSDSSPSYISSDSDLRPLLKRGKRPARGLREPYKLRRQPLSRQPYSPAVKSSPSSSKQKLSSDPCAAEREKGEGQEGRKSTCTSDDDVVVTKVTNVNEEDEITALNETPSSLSDYLLSNTTCDLGLNLLFCNEQVPFLPQRRLEFVDENMAKSTRHLGEVTGIDARLQLSKSEEKNDRSLEDTTSASRSSDQLETSLPLSLPPDPPSACSSLSTSLPTSLPSSLSPSLPSPLPTSTPNTTHLPPSLSSSSGSAKKQSLTKTPSDLSLQKSPSKPQAFPTSTSSSSRRRSSTSTSQASVTTRYRAQTAFENSKGKDRGKQGKVAPKELVIMWDHNEFKCQHPGCGKSFRKQSLLISHMKHYHSLPMPPQARGKRGKPAKPQGDKTLPKSPSSPSSPSSSLATSTLSKLSPKPSSPTSLPSASTAAPPAPPKHQIGQPLSAKKSKVPQYARVPPVEQSKVTLEKKKNESVPMEGIVYTGGVSSKSPKKGTRPKSSPHKPLARGSNAMEIVATGTPAVGSSAVDQNQTVSHVTSHRTFALHTSKHKSWPPRKHKEKSKESGSSVGRKMQKPHPHQSSPSVPSSSAADFPLHRPTGSHHEVVVASQNRVSVTDSGRGTVRSRMQIVPGASVVDAEEEAKKIVPKDSKAPEQISRPTSPISEANDDVVHCVCGDDTDEGFMIQCEQCLCWQHGECIDIREDTLPEKYLCCFCTNPPGLRQNQKYQYDLQWYSDGTLPSLPGGPKFPCPEAMLKCHALLDRLHLLQKMSHSSKVKLQAARNPHHPYLRQWAKECAHLDKETLKNYLASALEPVAVRVSEADEADELNGGERKVAETSGELNVATIKKEPSGVTTGGNSEGMNFANGESSSTGPEMSGHNTRLSGSSVKMSVVTQGASASTSAAQRNSRVSPVRSEAASNTVESMVVPKAEPPPANHSSSLEPDINSEFGVQELSVFAVKDGDKMSSKHAQNVSPQQLGSPTPLSLIPALPLSAQKTLTASGQSAFKPVIVSPKQTTIPPSASGTSSPYHPKTPTCTSSQLTSLLTSPISTHPQSLVFPVQSLTPSPPLPSTPTIAPLTLSQGLPTTSKPASLSHTSSNITSKQPRDGASSRQGGSMDSAKPCVTQLSRLSLVPNVGGDSIFAETASSLPAVPDSVPVLMKDFTEAFVRGDTTNWFKRMLLLDHIENVQESICNWLDDMERELDELSEEDEEDGASDSGSPSSLLQGVQSTMEQLSAFKKQVTGTTHS